MTTSNKMQVFFTWGREAERYICTYFMNESERNEEGKKRRRKRRRKQRRRRRRIKNEKQQRREVLASLPPYLPLLE
jgi:hypothetical protein